MEETDTTIETDLDQEFDPIVVRRNKVEEADMDITSMIDLTFLLLIFFMVASRIATKATVEMPEARHGDVIGERDAVIVTVAASGTTPQIYLGASIDPATLIPASSQEEQDNRVTAYVEEEIRKGKKHVLVQAAKGLKHRDVSRVARAAARAEVEKLHVGITEKK
jgi:biopolymer transport protein ExbD